MEEGPVASGRSSGPGRSVVTVSATPIAQVPADAAQRLATGIDELDRVLAGGLVPGSVTLLGGEPGAGKSTLLLQAADALARGGSRVLYVSAEESPAQVRLRAERLDALADDLWLASTTELDQVLALIEQHQPAVCVLDSVQTVRHPEASGHAGGTTQVRECAAALVRAAKAAGIAVVLVGHVTKEGTLAGPRVLEHLVDTVCELGGDRHHALRLLRATKHRYGAVGEVGCFELGDAGMSGVADAGRLFTGGTAPGTSGVALTVVLEGERALACEVQALVAPSQLSNPRRVASGLDGQRMALLLAVLDRRAGVSVRDADVYASTVGGMRLVEPGVDLALALAIASSVADAALPTDVVVIGEVGLAGELRGVTQLQRRLSEAARLGFSGALLPGAYDGPGYGLDIRPAATLADAVQHTLASGT